MNHTEQHAEHGGSVRKDVMDAIRKGRVTMKPHSHFVLLTVVTVSGAFILLLTLLYVASLAVFLLRESGAWFLPVFGFRGIFTFLTSIPWLLVLLLLIFLAALEILARRFAFVYQKPLLLSALAVALVIILGGVVLAPFHRGVFLSARHHHLPPPLGDLYRAEGMRRFEGVYHGRIYATTTGGFIITDVNDSGTSTIVITPATRLPYGADFSLGDLVVVFGDTVATDTVRAFGIREVEE